MRKTILSAIAILLLTACQESLEEKCEREAREYTRRNCPAKVEENVVVDSMTFDRNTHTIHYHYRLTGLADKEGALDANQARQLLLKALKNTTALQACKDADYNFAYTYRSEKEPQRTWLDIVLRPEDYKGHE